MNALQRYNQLKSKPDPLRAEAYYNEQMTISEHRQWMGHLIQSTCPGQRYDISLRVDEARRAMERAGRAVEVVEK